MEKKSFKKKLNLEELQVESFVTSINESDKKTVEGGITPTTTTATTVLIASVGSAAGSYAQCKNIGNDISDAVSNAGVACRILGTCWWDSYGF